MTIAEMKQKWLASYGYLAEKRLPPSKRSPFGEDPLGDKENHRKSRSDRRLTVQKRGSRLSENDEIEGGDQKKWSIPFGKDAGLPGGGRKTVGEYPDAGETGETIGGEGIPDFQDQLQQGIEHEMHQMTHPDRSVAIDTVVKNLRTNPRYYMDLVMLGLGERKQRQGQALQGILGDMIEMKKARAACSSLRSLQESVRSGF